MTLNMILEAIKKAESGHFARVGLQGPSSTTKDTTKDSRISGALRKGWEWDPIISKKCFTVIFRLLALFPCNLLAASSKHGQLQCFCQALSKDSSEYLLLIRLSQGSEFFPISARIGEMFSLTTSM